MFIDCSDLIISSLKNSSCIKEIYNSIKVIIPTNIPVYKKCLNCGCHFKVDSPVGFHKCPHCGSIICI